MTVYLRPNHPSLPLSELYLDQRAQAGVVLAGAVVAVVAVVAALVVEVTGTVLVDGAGGGGTKVSLQNPLLFTILLTPPPGWG